MLHALNDVRKAALWLQVHLSLSLSSLSHTHKHT